MENHQYFIQSKIIIYKLIYLQKKKMEPFRRVSNEGGKKIRPCERKGKKKRRKENDLSKRDNLEKKRERV